MGRVAATTAVASTVKLPKRPKNGEPTERYGNWHGKECWAHALLVLSALGRWAAPAAQASVGLAIWAKLAKYVTGEMYRPP